MPEIMPHEQTLTQREAIAYHRLSEVSFCVVVPIQQIRSEDSRATNHNRAGSLGRYHNLSTGDEKGLLLTSPPFAGGEERATRLPRTPTADAGVSRYSWQVDDLPYPAT